MGGEAGTDVVAVAAAGVVEGDNNTDLVWGVWGNEGGNFVLMSSGGQMEGGRTCLHPERKSISSLLRSFASSEMEAKGGGG